LKSRSVYLLITLLTAVLMISSSKAESVVHIPKISPGGTLTFPEVAPYMAGYMDTDSNHFGVKKINVTVSFPDTDPSVIQTDNWLAGGMFAVGYGGLHQIDYGFYTMLTLEHDGDLYLDFGLYKTYECLPSAGGPEHPPPPGFPYGPSPWAELLFHNALPVEEVSPSTPITLTASWDTPQPDFVSWEYTVNGNTYTAEPVNVTELAPTIIHEFQIGTRYVEESLKEFVLSWLGPYWLIYCFQFGVTSSYNIGHGGWNVLLSNPSYFKDGVWHNVETAKSMGGGYAYMDYRWRWGGTNYEGVEAYYYPFLGAHNVKFYYSGFTLEYFTPLWRPEDETSPPHVIEVPIRPSDDSSTYTSPDSIHAYAETNLNSASYRLEVGEAEMNGTDYSAGASLFKNYVPTHTITNPTFYFRFHDVGYMASKAPYPASYTWLYFYLRLWHNGNQVFECTKLVHYVTNDALSFYHFHDVIHTYAGELLEGNTYTIEYSFDTFEHEAYTDFRIGEHNIKAKWLAIADNYKLTVLAKDQYSTSLTTGDVYIDDQLVGYTNSTFTVEAGTYEVWVNDFWECNNTGWRYGWSVDNPRNITVVEDTTITAYFYKKECPGDVNGDGKVNWKDIYFVNLRFGAERGEPNWDSRADLNCDTKIDWKDQYTVILYFGKVYE